MFTYDLGRQRKNVLTPIT